MKYWYDTEFVENGSTIDLISIGVVAEDGREFYAESLDADLGKASDWVKENVLPHLWSRQSDKRNPNGFIRDGGSGGWLYRRHLKEELRSFCDPAKYGAPEFWGYFSAYDHVALCQLFGTMMDLPFEWPMFTRDIQQEAARLGALPLPEQTGTAHNALEDARWTRDAYLWLQGREKANT